MENKVLEKAKTSALDAVMARMSYEEFVRLKNKRVSGKFCRHCIHRVSRNRMQYCELQVSHYSKNGFRSIHSYDDACGLYEQKL